MLKKIILLILLAFSIGACNDHLDEINSNPNATEQSQPAFLLTGTLKQGADLYWGSDNNFGTSLLFVQHWASIQYTESDRYEVSNTKFTSLWNTAYAGLITDLNTILEFPPHRANNNYKGIALALRSWVFLLLTDAYGDIPYTEAGQKISPAYDAQRLVYTGLLSDLLAAQSLLDISKEGVEGDLVYGGNISKWKKLTNSLRLRIALRIADKDPALAKSIVGELTSNGAGLISSKDDIFQFVYTSSPQQNPAAAWFETRNDYRISKTMVDKLYDLNDPRLPIFAQLPSDTAVHQYVGVPNGLSNSDANSLGFAKTSKPGAYFLRSQSPAVLYSYAEVLFGLSEAVARGFIDGNAQNLYQDAIKASFNQFGITDAGVIADYLQQATVQYHESNFRKTIGEQKWIAFFGQGLDAFAEWRRLGYPELKAGPASVLEDKIPQRFFYPGTEQSLNGKSYKLAIQNQGEDLLTTKLWFAR